MGIFSTAWSSGTTLQRSFYQNVAEGMERAVNALLSAENRISPSIERATEYEAGDERRADAFERWCEDYDDASSEVGAPPAGVLFYPFDPQYEGWFSSTDGPALTWSAIVQSAERGGLSADGLAGLRSVRAFAEETQRQLSSQGGALDSRDRTYFGRVVPRLQRALSQWVSEDWPSRRPPARPPSPSPARPSARPPARPPAPPRRGGLGALVLLLGGVWLFSRRRRGRV